MFQRCVPWVVILAFFIGLQIAVQSRGPGETIEFPRSNHLSSADLKAAAHPQLRLDLLEALDRVITYEHYYHSVYGHFTQVLNRLGFRISRELGTEYELRITEATKDRLGVTAFSEIDGRVADLVSIDQDYKLHSNFPIPVPRESYLRAKAVQQLRLISGSPAPYLLEEQTLFKGFFSFRRDPQHPETAYALGTQEPVMGIHLDGAQLAPSIPLPSDEAERGMSDLASQTFGLDQKLGPQELEEVLLAQKIFRGERGRFAKNWKELGEVVDFGFEEKWADFKGKQSDRAGETFPFKTSRKEISEESHAKKTRAPSSSDWAIEEGKQASNAYEVEPISQ
jgi:hypothetical protein